MDTSRALAAAALVQIAYRSKFVMPEGYTLRSLIYGDGYAGPPANGQDLRVFGFIAESPEEVVIALRGTETLAEWAQDARYSKTRCGTEDEPLYVETGFCDLFNSLTDVSEWVIPGKRLVITGHSLGAALVTLLGVKFSAYNPEVYAFAPPNVGDRAFADWYAKNVPGGYRLVVLTDVVPHVPPTLMGFVPAGTSIILNVIEDPVTSHDMRTYIAALEQGRILVGMAE